MRYPVAIEPGTESEAFGVVVPDLPGCFSAGDTMEEAMAKAEEAIAAWIETALDLGQDIPQPSSVDALRKKHRRDPLGVYRPDGAGEPPGHDLITSGAARRPLCGPRSELPNARCGSGLDGPLLEFIAEKRPLRFRFPEAALRQ
jgi:predicted RNase H-like HicB family nuclease